MSKKNLNPNNAGGKKLSELDKAKKLLAEEEKKQIDQCVKEINAILDKYNFKFGIVPNITINGRSPQVLITKK